MQAVLPIVIATLQIQIQVETEMLQDGVHSNSRTTLPRQHPLHLHRIRASALIRSAAAVRSIFQTTIFHSNGNVGLKNLL
jgi:hypothetical protein